MAMVGTIATGGYVVGPGDDKDNGNGFEFTRRKKWPSLLLQELVGSAIFCLKPVPPSPSDSSHGSIAGMGWKMIYASPAAGDMLNQKASELEGKDFFDLVFAPDQPHLQNLFSSLLTPQPPGLPHLSSSSTSTSTSASITPAPQFSSATPSSNPTPGSSKSRTTHVRMMADQPVVWELRAHATGMETINTGLAPIGTGPVSSSTSNFGYGGQGTVIPSAGAGGGTGDVTNGGNGNGSTGSGLDSGLKGKAIWVMGRRVAEGMPEGEANGQNLDAFLELKLENERLREELREVQAELDDEDLSTLRPLDPTPAYNPSSPQDTTTSSTSSEADSSEPKPKKRKEKDILDKEKKRIKKQSVSGPSGGPSNSIGNTQGGSSSNSTTNAAGGGAGGEGMHVCVTCGRTDSPEWRKGPLGPKTLCNACGLRWAKRNSTAPSRKERKGADSKK